MSAINTIWVLLGTALIFFMQAGFAMVEAGFTRAKNSGNIIMKNLIDVSIGTPLFWFVGFGFMYGSLNSIFGGFDFFINGNYDSILPSGVPLWAFVAFQTAFCATSATIVSGAMAERTRFSAYCLYSVAISLFVYPISGHWIWGGGFLEQLGFHDFAGSSAVHLVGGLSGLIGAKMLGPRIGKYTRDGKARAIPGHSITLGALGVFILWFAWFGFNGCSTVSMEGENIAVAGRIFMNTNMSAACAVVSAMIVTWIRYKKPDVSLTLNGALAGLVAITAGCDQVSVFGACVTGLCAGTLMVFSMKFVEDWLKVDDPVGAVSVHGCCGILGTLMCGLLSTSQGLLYGHGLHFFGVQLLGVAVVVLWVGVVMTCVFKLIDKTAGLRVSEREEIEGLDSTEHGLANAYADFLPSIQIAGDGSGEASVIKPVKNVPVEQAIPVRSYSLHSETSAIADQSGLTKIEVIMKQARFERFKEAMNSVGVTGMTVTQVVGCGMQRGASDYYRGAAVDMNLLPKVKVEIVVAKVPVEDVIMASRKALYTGHVGDGKIFIYDVRDAVKIRTGETGYDALQGIDDKLACQKIEADKRLSQSLNQDGGF